MTGGRAVFLDRDGVIVEPVPDQLLGTRESPYRPEDVALVPGAAGAIRLLRGAGWVVIGVSNQPAAAKGTACLKALRAVHERTAELLAAQDAALDDWRYCLHHPQGTVAELTRPCACRKPAPGMLLDAAATFGLDLSNAWMVGDADTDIEAGLAAGTATVLIAHAATSHRRASSGTEPPTLKAADLVNATKLISDYPGVNPSV